MAPFKRWPRASWAPLPGKDEVHVWRMLLDAPPSCIESLRKIIASEELARAERFRFETDRRRFTVARGSLRGILGRYLAIPPDRLQFRYGAHGKPRLAEETGGTRLRFNLAHSQDRALCAVSTRREVGVDLERVAADVEDEVIAEHFFSSREIVALCAVLPERRPAMFYRYWTQKEAFVKAIGVGLHFPLNRVEMVFASGKPLSLHDLGDSAGEPTCWSIHDLHPWSGYAAALAVEGHDVGITLWEWPTESLPRLRSPRDADATG